MARSFSTATSLTPIISFLLIAAAVYYFVVLPVNHLMKKFEKPALPDKKKCPECQSDIPIAARRCALLHSASSPCRTRLAAACPFRWEAVRPRLCKCASARRRSRTTLQKITVSIASAMVMLDRPADSRYPRHDIEIATDAQRQKDHRPQQRLAR